MREKNEIEEQTVVSTFKGLLGAIPFVGGAINEFAFEARGRIKQARINKFIIAFSQYMAQFQNVVLDIDQVEKEEFGDFFEAVIIKISRNHSEMKKEAFKKLLANQILRPQDIDYAEFFLELISTLQERQLPILQGIRESSSRYISIHEQIHNTEKLISSLREKSRITNEIHEIQREQYLDSRIENQEQQIKRLEDKISKLNDDLKGVMTPFQAVTYGIQNAEFYFLLQDLCNKGLLVDSTAKHGEDGQYIVEISQLGIDLLDSLAN